MNCKNTSCPCCGKCKATICERYTDKEPLFGSAVFVSTWEYLTFTTTTTNNEVTAHFNSKCPDDVAYINHTKDGDKE